MGGQRRKLFEFRLHSCLGDVDVSEIFAYDSRPSTDSPPPTTPEIAPMTRCNAPLQIRAGIPFPDDPRPGRAERFPLWPAARSSSATGW